MFLSRNDVTPPSPPAVLSSNLRGEEMFTGRISLTNISALQLPWTNENRVDQQSDLRPYLAVSVDAQLKSTVGYQESSEVEHMLNNSSSRCFSISMSL